MSGSHQAQHSIGSPFVGFNGRSHEGLMLLNRRGMLKAGVSGVAGLTLPGLLKARAEAAQSGAQTGTGKSLILLWMAGGPSQIDSLDPKPDRPFMNRGPFGVTQTKLPGVLVCEHLPKMAAMLDRFTLIRSVDCRGSNHEPNTVMQTANLAAEPRVNREAVTYPSIGSIVAKHHGANHPSMPPYVAFMKSRSHLAFAGHLGKTYDPFIANQATKLPVYDLVGKDTGVVSKADLFRMPEGLSEPRIQTRQTLMRQFDVLRRDLDQDGSMEALEGYSHQAANLLTGGQAQQAFDLDQEAASVRAKYGPHLWCQQALIARRLVEAGVSFVTLDLSYHGASGTWDTHGDNIPPYGGISKGLGPLLPLFDHLITTLVSDLEERGLLDNTLVMAMGEFGRTPYMGTQDSSDGRNHWPEIMSMSLAGGGLRHGQVIGASAPDGGHIAERPVRPGDLAATIYRHFGVPLDTTYNDPRGRPNFILDHGVPIHELF